MNLVTSLATGGLIKGNTKPKDNTISAQKVSFYTEGNKDIFVVRGTADNDDLLMDGILVIQDSIRNLIQHPTIANKEKEIIRYIRENHKDKSRQLILTGHSLGSYHINNIMDKFDSPRAVGFAHAGFNINPKAEMIYSFDKDPIYRPSKSRNHKVFNKSPSAFIHNPFSEFHSTNNFY